MTAIRVDLPKPHRNSDIIITELSVSGSWLGVDSKCFYWYLKALLLFPGPRSKYLSFFDFYKTTLEVSWASIYALIALVSNE